MRPGWILLGLYHEPVVIASRFRQHGGEIHHAITGHGEDAGDHAIKETQIVPARPFHDRPPRVLDQRIEAHGADGLSQVGNVVPTTLQLATASGFRSDPVPPFFVERYAAACRAELDAFVKAARREEPARTDGEDGSRALLLANAGAEAAKSGRIVRPAEV
jgi:predicted dehydrogenase